MSDQARGFFIFILLVFTEPRLQTRSDKEFLNSYVGRFYNFVHCVCFSKEKPVIKVLIECWAETVRLNILFL